MTAARDALSVIGAMQGVEFWLQECPAGARHYRDTGVALPDTTLRACEVADAILFGAMGLPDVHGPDGTEVVPQLDLRFHFDLYAGVRPIRSLPNLPGPLSGSRASAIDLVLVRENIEGLFFARGRGDVRLQEDGTTIEVRDTLKMTRTGITRICEFAFELARKRQAARGLPGRVTSVDKANVFRSFAFWRAVFTETAQRHPDIASDSAYVDAMALNLVLKPWTYDVLVTENLFGDILSDLMAGLIGGMGVAPSADIGDKHALFQPAHGTAPDIAGQGKANPTAMLLSAAMMLDWLAVRSGDQRLADGAMMLDGAVREAFARARVRPIEFGGADGTTAITRAVLDILQERH